MPHNRRAKAGLVRFAADPAAAGAQTAELLGLALEGSPVVEVLVEERLPIERELFVSFAVDTDRRLPVALASAAGGVDIEETQERDPDAVRVLALDPWGRDLPFRFRELWAGLGLDGATLLRVAALYRARGARFFALDATILELNPVGLTRDADGAPGAIAAGVVLAVDDLALARQPAAAAVAESRGERTPTELERQALDVAAREPYRGTARFMELEGEIGLLVGGGGGSLVLLRRRAPRRRPAGLLHGDRRQPVRREGARARARRALRPRASAVCSSATTSRTTPRSTSSPREWSRRSATSGSTRGSFPSSRGRSERTTSAAGSSSSAPGSSTSARRRRSTRPRGASSSAWPRRAGGRAVTLFFDAPPRVVVQGATGREASMVVRHMSAYGTRVAAGVTPGKGGGEVEGVPVFDTSGGLGGRRAVRRGDRLRAAAGGARRGRRRPRGGRPVRPRGDRERPAARRRCGCSRSPARAGATLVGPNSVGVISPGARLKLGAIGGDDPERAFVPGRVGVVSRSGGLTAEVGLQLRRAGLGVSTAVSIGGDAMIGTTPADAPAPLPRGWRDRRGGLRRRAGDARSRRSWPTSSPPTAPPRRRARPRQFMEEFPQGTVFGHAGAVIERGRGSSDARRSGGSPRRAPTSPSRSTTSSSS